MFHMPVSSGSPLTASLSGCGRLFVFSAPFHLYSKGIKQEALLYFSYLGKLGAFSPSRVYSAGLEWKSWHWIYHCCNGAQFRKVSAEFCVTQGHFGAPVLNNKRLFILHSYASLCIKSPTIYMKVNECKISGLGVIYRHTLELCH